MAVESVTCVAPGKRLQFGETRLDPDRAEALAHPDGQPCGSRQFRLVEAVDRGWRTVRPGRRWPVP
jgi:hypothetical protein